MSSVEKPGILATFPVRASGWRQAVAELRSRPTQSRILTGSVIMLTSSGLVTVFNFAFNVAMARMLGPSSFGHVAVAMTLLMLVSAVTLSFQLVCAKFVAKNEAPGARAMVYTTLRRRAWLVGASIGLALALGSGWVSSYLNLPSPWIIVLLAVAIAFNIPLGVRRGGFQGTCSFPRLAASYVLENLTKLLGGVALVALGFGVLGAVAAFTAAVMLAYLLPPMVAELSSVPQQGQPASFREGMQAIVFFTGQVVLMNTDLLLVKHFFTSEQAGLYAAVTLVGRVLYYASWSVVSAMFPISAQTPAEESTPTVIAVPLLFVTGVTAAFAAGLHFFAGFVMETVFGAHFRVVAAGMEGLLSLAALSIGLYCVSVVLITFEMSRKIANTGWLQLVVAGIFVGGIYLFHDTLREVVLLQLTLMVLLLIAVSFPFFRKYGRRNPRLQEAV